jgi:hypothetical protein
MKYAPDPWPCGRFIADVLTIIRAYMVAERASEDRVDQGPVGQCPFCARLARP